VKSNNPERADVLLAERALNLFIQERKNNPDIAIIVKAGTIKEAERLLGVYRSQGWDNLGIIHSDRHQDQNEEVIARVRGEKDGVRVKPSERLAGFVSVDMAGEGVDIPNLRIAVFHKAPKTFPYTVQLIGRVSRRKKGEKGGAFLVANPEEVKGAEVQELYWSDKGWSEILPDLFAEKLDQSKFEPEPGSLLAQLPWLATDDFNPYLSVKVYQNGQSRGPRRFELQDSLCCDQDMGTARVDQEPRL
jgi:superfamily II DNA/RNA helicase